MKVQFHFTPKSSVSVTNQQRSPAAVFKVHPIIPKAHQREPVALKVRHSILFDWMSERFPEPSLVFSPYITDAPKPLFLCFLLFFHYEVAKFLTRKAMVWQNCNDRWIFVVGRAWAWTQKRGLAYFRQIAILAMPSAHLNGDFFIGASLTHLTYLTTLAWKQNVKKKLDSGD